MDIIQEIKKLKKQKNAIILGHFYQLPEIQDISDFIGDSLALAQQAEKTEADLIIFAGVSFMAETAKLINPTKKVILPDLNAGCSLADSCPAEDFKNFKVKYPDHLVVSYINTTNAIKALSDIICTSSNALAIINSFPKEQKLIFAPDKNLGNYLNKMTGRNMVVWPGACHVHKRFSLERILQIKEENKEAKIEEITGIRRSLPQIWKFFKRMKFKYRKVHAVPGKALTPEKQEEQDKLEMVVPVGSELLN